MASLTPERIAELDVLFPTPPPAPPLAPARLAGISPESDSILLKCLKENHVKWHIFFNDRGFHKYVTCDKLDMSC